MKNKNIYRKFYFSFFLILLCQGCSSKKIFNDSTDFEKYNIALAYEDLFLVGVALSNKDFHDKNILHLVNNNYSSVTHEFAMKWSHLEVKKNTYDFNRVDNFVNYFHGRNFKIIGHTLIWHKENPPWLFTKTFDDKLVQREYYLLIMRKHIHTVMKRYKGKIHGWDVVNEAFNPDGSIRKNNWYFMIGPDYIEKAFEYAFEADPNVELYYNDYGLESNVKLSSVITLVENLKKKGIPVHGIGFQGHYSLNYPELSKLDKAIKNISSLGLKVMITELDVSVLPLKIDEEISEDSLELLDPYKLKLPYDLDIKLSERYTDIFCVLLNNRSAITRVTFWGITDLRSWRNDWPIKGRTDYPLLYDRKLKPKKALNNLVELAHSHSTIC